MLVAGKMIKIDGVQGPSYVCACDCGGEKIVRAKDLKSGNTKSCGCRKTIGLN